MKRWWTAASPIFSQLPPLGSYDTCGPEMWACRLIHAWLLLRTGTACVLSKCLRWCAVLAFCAPGFSHTPKDGVMTCFQITVSAKHSLDLVALENAARGLDIAKIVIYWVVPRDSFREFNRKQTFGPQLVFEQRVLSLAAPRNPFTEQEMQERL